MKQQNEKHFSFHLINICIIALSSVIRLFYILYTTVGDRQHDLGYATLLNDGIINPGHLGYVEYLAKFHHLPDFNPFSVFSYYHPPVHYIIASAFVCLAKLLGIDEPLSYEAIQIPCLIYSILTVCITYWTLKLFTNSERKVTLPLLLIGLNPGLIYMTGSVNNDMLATLAAYLCVFFTLKWIKTDYKNKYLYLMALAIGMGMIIKENVVVLAVPMAFVMLLDFIKNIKNGCIKSSIIKYCIFAAIALPIGLSWTIRNFVRFHVAPGVQSANPSSHEYFGNYPLSEIILIPAKSAISFPFHGQNAIYCHNTWQILIKTMLFTEIWPEDISTGMLFICQLLYILSCIIMLTLLMLTLVRALRRIKTGDTATGVFLLSGILTILITYVLFVIKYPYTCSCDFRYVAVSLIFFAISILPINPHKE